VLAAAAVLVATSSGLAVATPGVPNAPVRSAPTSAEKAAPRNLAAKPDYSRVCGVGRTNSASCIRATLAAINRAHRREHVRPMVLPRNFAKLTPAEQTFVASNLERVDRGMRPFIGIASSFDGLAAKAAKTDTDPELVSWTQGPFRGEWEGGNWAGDLGPLPADYNWMYTDGYDSGNLACPTAKAAGCWGHRVNILGAYRHLPLLVSGTASTRQRQWVSLAQLFVAGVGKPPTLVYTWKQALAHGADRHR
jgi:hypothetical protein